MNSTKIQNVLLVDDDDNIRIIVEISLEGLTSWKLRKASNGTEALACIEEEVPDLVLLDVMMPDLTGIEVLERIKESGKTRQPFVIFMTAKVQKSEIESYLSLGAAGVIIKPFDPMKLPEQIEEILEPLLK